MKKNELWKIRGHNVLAVLGAFVLAVAGMSALACADVSDAPTNKPPEEEPGTVSAKVTSLKGARTGENNDIIDLTWTNPKSGYDSIKITFLPKADTVVEQPVSLDKSKTSWEVEGLDITKAYTFKVILVKGSLDGTAVSVRVAGSSADPTLAIPAALENATGGDGSTPETACTVTLAGVDLSSSSNMNELFAALKNSTLTNGGKSYYNLDLSGCSITDWTRRYPQSGAEKVVKLVLPDDAITIETSLSTTTPAFQAYTSLQEISGAAVDIVGANAFNGKTTLTAAAFPEATVIEENAFRGTSLTAIDYPEALTVGVAAFHSIPTLTSAALPKVKVLSEGIFYQSGLTSASFPAAETIGKAAFQENYALATLSFPAALTIGNFAFMDCRALTVIPAAAFEEVTTILGNDAFKRCYSLTEVHFPSVTTLGDYAFILDYQLAIADFPMVETIGMGAFISCTSLKLASDSGASYFPNVKKLGATLFAHMNAGDSNSPYFIGNYKVQASDKVGPYPDDMPEILPLPPLTSLSGFSSVEEIGDKAFWFVTTLSDVNLPNLQKTGLQVFDSISALQAVTLGKPDEPTSTPVALGNNVFKNSSNLVTVNAKVKSFGTNPFLGLTTMKNTKKSLTDIGLNLSELESMGDTMFEGWTNFEGDISQAEWEALDPTNPLKELEPGTINLPQLVSVGKNVFKGTRLKVVNAPKLAVSIGDSAFESCTQLKAFNGDITTTPATLVIGTNAFKGCTSLETFIAKPKTVWDTVFDSCTKIKEAKSLTAIGLDLSEVETVGKQFLNGIPNFEGDISQAEWDDLESDDQLKELEPGTLTLPKLLSTHSTTSAFWNNKIKVVNAPSLVTIGTSAFQASTQLTTFNAPSLVTIGSNAFQECPLLATVTTAATSIAANAFYKCPALDELYVGATPPTTTAPNVFNAGVGTGETLQSPNGFTIYVPAGTDSGAAAKTAWETWRNGLSAITNYDTRFPVDVALPPAPPEDPPTEE